MKKEYLFFAIIVILASCKNIKQRGSSFSLQDDSVSNNNDPTLKKLLKSTDAFVVSSIPAITMFQTVDTPKISAIGYVGYDFRQVGIVSSRIEGRIEKLYVRSRFQEVHKGDPIYEIYSPELLTSQKNLIYLLQNDQANTSLIRAAKERLSTFGLTTSQIEKVVRSQKINNTVTVFSNYSGYVTEMDAINRLGLSQNNLAEPPNSAVVSNLEPLSIKEGSYLQKGQTLFQVVNKSKVAISININDENGVSFQRGSQVELYTDDAPERKVRCSIDHMDPFVKNGSKSLSATIYLSNSELKIPIGSTVKAMVFGRPINGNWLPSQAVISSGIKHVVFKKADIGFKPVEVFTGISYNDKIQIVSGLSQSDSLAANAQQLVGNESIIKLK